MLVASSAVRDRAGGGVVGAAEPGCRVSEGPGLLEWRVLRTGAMGLPKLFCPLALPFSCPYRGPSSLQAQCCHGGGE
jgi:hypothetical protein